MLDSQTSSDCSSHQVVNDHQNKTVSQNRMESVLIVDDEFGIRSFLEKGLKADFGLVDVAESVEKAEVLRQRCHYDLIIVDIRLPAITGVEWIKDIREQGSSVPVIFMTAYADMETAIEALRAGAADFLLKPFRMEQMKASIRRCLEGQKMMRENFVLKRQVDQYISGSGMVGDCPVFHNMCDIVRRVAPMPSTVLIEGESGTGKELVARGIHECSKRSGSFVPVNCGAMSAELLESELFGHIKGAFTGAHQAREGLFTYANGGTLFLDEIGEMPMSMQTHLLRVLEEHSIRPVGGNQEIPIDVRIVAATNRELKERVEQGLFRSDLYYRLNVLSIRVPTLQERKSDIPLLIKYFNETLSAEMGINILNIGEDELLRLQKYAWPGNVRELRNVMERSLLLNITPSQCVFNQSDEQLELVEDEEGVVLLEAVEKKHILSILEQQGGNKTAAAKVLGISRKTLERRTKAWDIGEDVG